MTNDDLMNILASITLFQMMVVIGVGMTFAGVAWSVPILGKHPHFNRDNLAAALPKSGVEYHRLEALGGRRQKQQDESPNLGLENAVAEAGK
jgi:hypothetical protein